MSAPQGSRMPFGRLHGPATVLGKVVTGLVVVALVAAAVVLWPRQGHPRRPVPALAHRGEP